MEGNIYKTQRHTITRKHFVSVCVGIFVKGNITITYRKAYEQLLHRST